MTARARIEAERRVVRRRLAGLLDEHDGFVAASRDTNADDEHDPEGATIAFERSQVDSLLRQVQRRLTELDAALVRLDVGDYGRCERCGRAIDPDRLDARPEARTCLACVPS